MAKCHFHFCPLSYCHAWEEANGGPSSWFLALTWPSPICSRHVPLPAFIPAASFSLSTSVYVSTTRGKAWKQISQIKALLCFLQLAEVFFARAVGNLTVNLTIICCFPSLARNWTEMEQLRLQLAFRWDTSITGEA